MDVIGSFCICFTVATASFLCAYNLCKYMHVDEKETLQRLLAIKNSDYKSEHKKLNSFALPKSPFQFKIFSKILKNIKSAENIKLFLEKADITWQVDTFVIASIILGIIPLFLGLIFTPAAAIFCPVGIAALPLYIKFKIKKRTTTFTQQLPDALDLLCNALRAGHSLFSAFDIIVKEMPEPTNKIFKTLTDEIALGVDIKDAMKSLQKSVPDSVDLRFFTTVVILQREIGGNLIKLLEILAKTIRERFKMIGQLKAQTMQARLSGIIVSVIPPIIAAILFVMAPEYMDYLINHIWGKTALAAAFVLMVTGYIIINKITNIEV